MSSDEDESRSERLRRRRSKRQQPDESDERTEGDETAELSEPSETSKPPESVKDEQVGTYMYIPESQKKEIERLYNILKAEYEYEYDAGFEKNRHFYPILVQYGLDGLDGLDASEIQDRLDSI
jgi:hypothetical protein